MSEGAANTSIVYLKKRDKNAAGEDDESTQDQQGDIFRPRAEYIGVSPSGRPIEQNDLLSIKDQYRHFEEGHWEGIEMRSVGTDKIKLVRAAPAGNQRLWLEPETNRTSLLYDRLSYVLRAPIIKDRFSYCYFHPRYVEIVSMLTSLPINIVPFKSLCEQGFPRRGRKPSEESAEGIIVLKVRNVTGNGINFETDYAPDTSSNRSRYPKVNQGDVLITSTGEGTIGPG